MNFLQNQDPDIYNAINDEADRQQFGLEMIASENYTSPAIMEAAGSILTNKYAEGYPGRRYYGGCEHVDVIEDIARDRAKELFGAAYANVQPNSGSQANQAVYLAALDVGDTVLGLDLGARWSSDSRYATEPLGQTVQLRQLWRYQRYKSHRLRPGRGAGQRAQTENDRRWSKCLSARDRPREVQRDRRRTWSALLFVDMAHYAGLVAGGVHNSPVPHADFVTTTTHKTLRGPRAGLIMCKKKWAKKINSAVFPGMQGGPLMHIVAGKAVCFAEALKPDFKQYAQNVVDNCQGTRRRIA